MCLKGGINMRQFGVIGLGRFGSSVARTLSENGYQVLGIDIEEEAVQAVSEYATQAVQIDGIDAKSLTAVGMNNIDVAIVGIGDKIEASVLITLNLKEIGVKEIVCKAISNNHGKVLEKVGATKVVFPERDMGIRIANSLISPKIFEHIGLPTSQCSILEMHPHTNFVGKSLMDLKLRAKYGLNVIAIKSHQDEEEKVNISPNPDQIIEEDDIMVVFGSNENIENIKHESK